MLTVYKKNITTNADETEVHTALVPSIFFVPAATSTLAVDLTASLSAMPPGDYIINATVAGPGAAEYQVESTTLAAERLYFTVLSGTQPLPAPVIKSAVYAADGSHVKVSFDSATDRGGTATKFTCSQLFNFTCAAISRCQWVNNATVHAFVASESHCVAPGDQLSIQSSALIKAVCFSGSCYSGLSTVSTTVTIMASDSAVAPVVSITVPSTIGRCSSLTIDVSGSTGSGGRPWGDTKLTVVASTASANVAAIQRFLDTEYRISPPTAIPWQLLTSDVTYTFTANLCNFIGKCGQRQRRVTVLDSALPTVTIAGPAMREVKANEPLTITAEAYVTDCHGNKTTDGLTYQWSVSINSITLPHLLSQSRDPSKLLLSAYSLSVGTQYTVSLAVSIASSQKSTISSVQVMVVQGDVTAVIAGGTSQAVTAGDVVRLDASGSYDEDTHGVTGASAGLTFQWTCKQIEPILNADCSNIILNHSEIATNTSVFTASMLDSAVDTVAEITVTVLDASGGRSAASTVRLTVLPETAPIVALSSNAVNSVVNSDREVKLFGSVTLPTTSDPTVGGNVTWSVDDTSIVSLSDVALAPLVVPIPPDAVHFDVYMVFSANSLPIGSSLSFTLTCSSESGYSSSAAVKVVINAPPQPGAFAVSAMAASPMYTLAAANWIDSDLPLTYQFGYTSNAGAKVALTTRSAATHSAVRVPVGLASAGYMVECFAEIFDSHNANATVTALIQAMPSIAADTQSQVATLFASSGATVNEKKQIAAVASGLLNTVDCSLAPDCAALNRTACYKTRNTCGECKPSYIGDAGDSNSQCVLASVSVSSNLPQPLNSSCLTGDQCGLFQSCVEGRCIKPNKQCPFDCSGHGQCVAENINAGKRVSRCEVGDTSCEAVCLCEADYEGSSDCGMTTTETAARQASREVIISSIDDLMELEDPDAQSVEAWINSLAEATQAPDELSEAALSVVLKMSVTLMDYASQVGLSGRYTERLLNTIDSASKASANSFTRSRRRLDGSANSTNYSNSLAQSESALQKYADLISSNMLPGQYPVELVYAQFRSNIQVYSVAADASNLSVSVPLSALERLNGLQSSSFSLPHHSSITSSNVPLRVSVVSMLSSLYQAAEGSLESNPLTISMSVMPACAIPPCNIEIVLQYSQSLNRTELHPNEPEFVETLCLKDVIVTKNHTCNDGSIISLFCNGSASFLSQQCPYTEFAPVCNSLLGSEVVTDVCTAVAITDTNITCSCPMVTEGSMRRMLTDTNSTGYSASYVSMLSTIRTSFLTTVRSADDLDADTMKTGWRVVVTVGVFAAAVVVALISSNQADEIQKTSKTKEKNISDTDKKSFSGSLKAHLKIATETASSAKQKRKTAAVTREKTRQIGGINKDLALIESSLPSVLSSQTLSTRIVNEVKHNHRWLGVVFFYSDSFPRVLRVISLASNIIIMLFIQSLTYTLTNPDDGSCDLLTTKISCEEPLSPFATGESKCAWDDAQCSFLQPGNSVKIILFVAIFSAIISTPFALGTEWVVRHILAVGTLKQNKVVATTTAGTADPHLVATESGRRAGRRTAVNASQASVFMAQAELLSLSSALRQYRESLSTNQKVEFDLVWGLTEDGQFQSPDNNNNHTGISTDQSLIKQLTRLCQVRTKKKTDVKQTVLDDLTRIIDSVAEETRAIESESVNNRLIGRKLLFLFQCDLLPGISGKILHSKGQRDALSAKRVPLSYKIAAWTMLLLQNTGMLFYILLFALNENEQRQGAWLQSFILWLVVEILFVSTAVAILTHVVIPLLTMRDVTKIKQQLMENVQAFHQSVANKRRQAASQKYVEDTDNEHKTDQPKPFNAAEYLFVSTRIAKKYPDIKEAQIIAQFSTPWPRQSYQHVTDVSKGYSKKFTAITRALTIISVFMLSSLLAIPPSLQDMVIGMVSTATIGYTTLLHIQLFGIFPLLAFCPFIVICVIVHFVIQSQKSAAKTRLAKLFPVTNVEFSAEKDEFSAANLDAKTAHKTRKQSVAIGMHVVDQMQHLNKAVPPYNGDINEDEEDEEDEDSSECPSIVLSDSDSDVESNGNTLTAVVDINATVVQIDDDRTHAHQHEPQAPLPPAAQAQVAATTEGTILGVLNSSNRQVANKNNNEDDEDGGSIASDLANYYMKDFSDDDDEDGKEVEDNK